MIVENRGYIITEVPGIQSIKIRRNEESEDGMEIVIDDGSAPAPRSWGVRELSVYIDALNTARQLAVDIRDGRA